MSKYIATRAIRGANSLVIEAELMLNRAIQEKGADTPVEFPNTAYFLPTIYGMTGIQVSTLGQLVEVLSHARALLHPVPSQRHWTPYLGETLDGGMATLLAAEIIEAIRFVYNQQPEPFPGIELAGGTAYPELDNGGRPAGHLNGPIDDIQLRSWGIQLVDGRMPGFAAIVGAAKSNQVAVKLVRELQRRNILIFLSGNVNGRSIIHQLQEEGVDLGYDTYTIPFGTDTLSAIYALGFATRSALTFGGIDAGQVRDILMYNKKRVFAFVLALGEVDDLKYAAAAGAINFGFPVIADTVIPEILPTGVTDYEHVVSMPFDQIEGADDLERAERMVQKCIEIRGVKIKMTEVPVPIPYGSAFEGEVVRKADMRVEMGGKYSRCFEFLRMMDMDEVTDGVVQIIGPDIDTIEDQGSMDMGIVVDVAGRKMQEDFEPVLERQIHYFVNGGSGLQHIGQRDITWIRISREAVEKGFTLEGIGKILHARLHAEFGAILDKVRITIYTDPDKVTEWLVKAREAYDYRNKRLADLTDSAVDEFYSCTLCQSFAPNHVCVVSPERLGLCGAYNWLDCKASYSINPTGPNQPIGLGKLIDPNLGYWEGTLDYAKIGSHGVIQDVSMYSIMENPMTACLTSAAEIIIDGQVVNIGEFVEAWEKGDSEERALTLNENGRLTSSQLLGVHKNPAPAELIHIETKSGLELTLTPNHPVAVDRWEQNGHGPWVRADALQAGDRLYALQRLDLDAKVPETIDLLSDEVRVTDESVLAEMNQALNAHFGSLAAAYRQVGLKYPDPRVKSIPLGDLRRLVGSLDKDWDRFKKRIHEVAPPDGHPQAELTEITPELLYLLGLLASDGSLDRRGKYQCRVNFTNNDDTLLKTYEQIYAQLFPTAALGKRTKEGGGTIEGRKISATQPSTDLYSNNFLLGLLSEALGIRMAGEQSWDLARLLPLPESHIAAFLAGVFDGDGSVRLRYNNQQWPVGEAYLSHSQKVAACHLQLLLKRLGIVGTLREDRTVYKVELHGSNLRRFAEQIPSRHSAKQEVLAQIAALPSKDLDKTQEQVLPFAAGQALAGLPESKTVLSPSTLFYYQSGRSRPVKGNLQRVIEAAPETAQTLSPYLENDFFLDTITRVETIPNQGRYSHVYNLSLLDVNSYLANGLHVKNCGCFECIVMYIPEVEGVMIVSREDTGMTPMGMKFSTLAGMAGGGVQTPGVMGVGKFYLISPKFISADGGFKRIVWMSKNLKDSMAAEFQVVAEREGIPDLIDRIADSENVTTVEELVAWVKEKDHPVLDMGPMVAESAQVEEDVIAQAEAVVEKAAAAKEEKPAPKAEKPAPPAAAPAPKAEAPPKVAAPALPGAPAQPGSIEARVDRLERSVKTLIGSLVGALAELGDVDVSQVAVPAPVPGPVSRPPSPVAPPPSPVIADTEWLPEGTATAIAKEKWSGSVRQVVLGATAAEGGTRTKTITIGGETSMPFMDFEGKLPHKPVVAIEIKDRRPDDWSELLYKQWGDAMNDPGDWAKAAEAVGADMLMLTLSLTDAEGQANTPEKAVAAVKKVLAATGLPLAVFGPGQAEIDNALIVPISDATKGERLLLGLCEDKNYRTIVASAMANGHLVNARTAMDVNLAKQLNILINDMGLSLDRIVMDPTTGALGYGFEYGYSVMERLRLAALQGDSMTQMPMLVTPGEECWKTKESKVGDGVPAEWGDWLERGITWETLTSVMLIESGADVVVLRHPESVRRTHAAIKDLMG